MRSSGSGKGLAMRASVRCIHGPSGAVGAVLPRPTGAMPLCGVLLAAGQAAIGVLAVLSEPALKPWRAIPVGQGRQRLGVARVQSLPRCLRRVEVARLSALRSIRAIPHVPIVMEEPS